MEHSIIEGPITAVGIMTSGSPNSPDTISNEVARASKEELVKLRKEM